MSAATKLRSGTGSELTRLKLLWRDTLSDEQRESWCSRFTGAEFTQAQLRSLLAEELGVRLKYDSQLNAFRDWELEQRARDLEAERQAEDERRALAEHPDWSLDQARESVLKKAYQRASAVGDFKLGLATVKQDLAAKALTLDRQKFEWDATACALAKLETLKAIKADSGLSEDQKLEQARLELFGVAPK